MARFDVDDLLRRYHQQSPARDGRLVELSGLDGMDGYNPSAAIKQDGKLISYVRVERRDDEFSSWSAPFVQEDTTFWRMRLDLPMLRVQDPAVTVIHGSLVVSGVRIVAKKGEFIFFRTVFWRGSGLGDLKEFSNSPMQLKDTRLVELADGRVGIFIRPMGGVNGRGQIAYLEVDGLDALRPEAFEQAELLDVQPISEQWWGVNDVWSLSPDRLGILGHVAKFAGATRRYYAFAAIFDRRQGTLVDGPHIICDRSRFPDSPSKRQDLVDTVFPASIDRTRGLLFSGVSDACIGVVPVGDPFANGSS